MSLRADLLNGFLDRAGWAGARIAPLAGDASARRYHRLHGAQGRAVLMDAPPDTGEDTAPFITIARHLADLDLSAPRIIASDPQNGFLLLEDLGDALFARVAADEPALERPLYAAALEVLDRLHRTPVPAVPRYGPDDMAAAANLALDWYERGSADSLRAELGGLVRDALDRAWTTPEVLVLRDYHAENLIWLPDRAGAARVGLLDFQDAMAGHPVYDSVSLLLDARRDVSAATANALRAELARAYGDGPVAFDRAFATLGAQRSLRILGVFARLCLRDGKPGYLGLMPRVWGQLQTCLAHPDLADLSAFVAAHLSPPDEDRLARLREGCAS